MIKSNYLIHLLLICVLLVGCNTSGKKKNESITEKDYSNWQPVNTTLFDKSLPEIKELLNGKWELVSGKNATYGFEYEDIQIYFEDDKYIWIEEGSQEPGLLKWQKTDTGNGYESYQMDVFSIPGEEEIPAYPVAIKGDTLTIQELAIDPIRYTLVRIR